MDEKKLLNLAEVLENPPEESRLVGFDLGDYLYEVDESRATKCGTVGCIAGWTVGIHLSEEEWNKAAAEDFRTLNVHDVAADILGLTEDQAMILFTPTNIDYYKVTADIAAKAVRNVAETGHPLWGKLGVPLYTGLDELAADIAFEAHLDQSDKAGVPYIKHPEAVADMVDTEVEKAVAWLHDVVEDSRFTFEDLYNFGFPPEVVEAVALLTKKKDDGRTYDQYITDLIASGNKTAIKVKIADNTHNSDRNRRVPGVDDSFYSRYDESKARLQEALAKIVHDESLVAG